MTERLIRTAVHGRYLVDPHTGPSSSRWLVGFHGYGENADKHLAELRRLPASGWRLASVQALHPFYNQKTDEVVASWMTRLDRERAIDDNIEYASAAVKDLAAVYGPVTRLVYVGFSQGVAMAYRAAARARHPCDGVIALAGDIPGELKDPSIRLPPILIARGARDTWYTDEVMSRDVEFLARHGVPFDTITFDGGHEWTDAFREAAGRFLRRLAADGRE